MAESYRALTRVYRPSSFEDIVAQEHVSSTLKNAIENDRLAHAYMFCGPRGVGKTTMARVLARTINQVDGSVDGEQLNQTLNITEIDAASNNKVEDVHSLRESVRIPPQNGRYKVYIIDEVHMLSKAAFNALLKTLEEPPAHVVFIFATTEPHKVLPTILSRVQRFDFRRIETDEIVSRLTTIAQKEGITIDQESMHLIAKRADGALRDALSLMDQAVAFCGTSITYNAILDAFHAVDVDDLFLFSGCLGTGHAADALVRFQELMQDGIDVQEFLGSMTEHFRHIYMAKDERTAPYIEATKDTRQRYLEAAKALSAEDALRGIHLVNQAQMHVREARQPRIQVEVLIAKLAHMTPSSELAALKSQLSGAKKKD